MRLLITGGAGFIGSNFLNMVLDQYGSEFSKCTVVDALTYSGNRNSFSKLTSREFEFVKGDIANYVLMEDLISKHDVVVNFAAETHVDRSIADSKQFIHSNVVGVHSILSAMVKNSSVKLVHVSTDEVYGSIATGSASEDYPLLPNSPYSASKSSADLLLRSFVVTHSLDAVITRCSNNYGPYQFPEKLIPLFITNLLEGKKIPIYGSGNNVRDWIHVSDHCKGILQVLKHGHSGEIFNIGGKNELSNIELTYKLLEMMGLDESKIDYVEDRLGHDFRYSIDTTKIEKTLNYFPVRSFDNGLHETIEWYIENSDWWSKLK